MQMCAEANLAHKRSNFTWAENGGGAHTKQAAIHVRDVLAKADRKGGLAGVESKLIELGEAMTKGIFF